MTNSICKNKNAFNKAKIKEHKAAIANLIKNKQLKDEDVISYKSLKNEAKSSIKDFVAHKNPIISFKFFTDYNRFASHDMFPKKINLNDMVGLNIIPFTAPFAPFVEIRECLDQEKYGLPDVAGILTASIYFPVGGIMTGVLAGIRGIKNMLARKEQFNEIYADKLGHFLQKHTSKSLDINSAIVNHGAYI